MLNRRQFLYTAATAFVGATATGVYTRFWEPYWVDVQRHRMPVRNLPSALIGKTLVQLSDLHVGTVVPDQFIADVFAQVRALTPDFVVYTGDFITHYPRGGMFAQMERVYADSPRGRIGTVGTLGNHDFGNMWSEADIARRVVSIMENAGVRMLQNEHAVFGRHGRTVGASVRAAAGVRRIGSGVGHDCVVAQPGHRRFAGLG
jgi:uncharacterized protein